MPRKTIYEKLNLELPQVIPPCLLMAKTGQLRLETHTKAIAPDGQPSGVATVDSAVAQTGPNPSETVQASIKMIGMILQHKECIDWFDVQF